MASGFVSWLDDESAYGFGTRDVRGKCRHVRRARIATDGRPTLSGRQRVECERRLGGMGQELINVLLLRR